MHILNVFKKRLQSAKPIYSNADCSLLFFKFLCVELCPFFMLNQRRCVIFYAVLGHLHADD